MSGKAKFDIVAEDKTRAAWNSAVGQAKASTDRIRGMLSYAFAGFSVSTIIGFGKAAIQLGDDLNKAAIKAGIGGKAISELAYAAKLADVPLEALSTALKKMQVTLSEARTGGKQQIETLRALGLEYRDLQGLGADKQFELIADRVSLLGRSEDRTRALTEIFGKAGADLAPLFEQGAAGIRKAREEAEKMGYSFSDEQLEKLSKTDDAIKRLTASWEALGVTLASKVANPLSQIMDDLSNGTAFDRLKKAAASPLGFIGEQLAKTEASAPRRGGVGRPGGDSHAVPVVPGYTDTAALEAAAKEQKKFLDGYHDALRDMNADVDREADEALKRDGERWMERQDQARETMEKWKEGEKELSAWREEQWTENARVFRDYFVDAISDMINTGKFKWRDFLSFMVAEIARRQIGKLFDSIFASAQANSGSGGSGWFGAIFGAIVNSYASNVGGAFASGSAVEGRAAGGTALAGRLYRINENTPNSELWMPDRDGTVIPSGALGGGAVFAPVYNIDARGATTDLVRALPGILRQNSEETEQRMVGRLRRDYYGLNQG